MRYVQDRQNRTAQLALRVEINGVEMSVEEAHELRLMVFLPDGNFGFDVTAIRERGEDLPAIMAHRKRMDREGLRFVGRVSEGDGFGLGKPA